jgi:hypothetical protein
MNFTAQEMIEFATWFSNTYGDDNTNATLADLELWQKSRQDWSGR